MKIGDKVTYLSSTNKQQTGTIYGIRRATNTDGIEQIVGYLIDTGRDHVKASTKKLKNIDSKKDDVIETERQPQQIELNADQITPVEE